MQELSIDCNTPWTSVRLAARAWGPENGLPILALHGWLDNAASFDRLAPLLPDGRIVALDLAGHGHSEHRPPGVGYHLMDYVFDVVAAADVLGWQRFTLLGHSLGAAIAGLVAAALPDRIERLLLIDGLGPLSESAEQAPGRLGRAVAEIQRPGGKQKVFPDVHAAAIARQRATGLDVDSARILAERGTRPVEGGVGWRTDPRLLRTSPIYTTEEQVRALLGAITCRTLLVLAEDGYVIKRPSLMGRVAAVPDIKVIRAAGNHHLHLEQPQPVARALLGAGLFGRVR